MHYSSTTNAILLLTLNLCVYFIYFIAVNTLGSNFFLICRNWPDDLLSFARRGELSRDWRGVSPLHTPPGVSALQTRFKGESGCFCDLSERRVGKDVLA